MKHSFGLPTQKNEKKSMRFKTRNIKITKMFCEEKPGILKLAVLAKFCQKI